MRLRTENRELGAGHWELGTENRRQRQRLRLRQSRAAVENGWKRRAVGAKKRRLTAPHSFAPALRFGLALLELKIEIGFRLVLRPSSSPRISHLVSRHARTRPRSRPLAVATPKNFGALALLHHYHCVQRMRRKCACVRKRKLPRKCSEERRRCHCDCDFECECGLRPNIFQRRWAGEGGARPADQYPGRNFGGLQKVAKRRNMVDIGKEFELVRML